jgi:hypothetical protein
MLLKAIYHACSYQCPEEHVSKDDTDADDHWDGDLIRGHVVLGADLLVNQTLLELLSQHSRGELRLNSLAPEHAAAQPNQIMNQMFICLTLRTFCDCRVFSGTLCRIPWV